MQYVSHALTTNTNTVQDCAAYLHYSITEEFESFFTYFFLETKNHFAHTKTFFIGSVYIFPVFDKTISLHVVTPVDKFIWRKLINIWAL
jgi:DNA repair protein RadC